MFSSSSSTARCVHNSKQEHNDVSRKRQRQVLETRHHNNKLETLLFHEIQQCDVCGRSLLNAPKSCGEESVANGLPKFIDGHIASSCQHPFDCTWCADDVNRRYSCCDSLYCSEKCRNRAESALCNSSTQTNNQLPSLSTDDNDADTKFLLIPPPKLFFCRNQYQRAGSIIKNDEGANEMVEEVVQSLDAIKSKFRSLCGNNIKMEHCALLVTTILSIVSPWWIDNFLQSLGGDDHYETSSFEEESLTEELWALAKSHWSMVKHPSERNDAPKQQFMPYQSFFKIYLCIKRRCICRLTVTDHPLVSYARDTLISDALTEMERDLVLSILDHPCLPLDRHVQSKTNDNNQCSVYRWRNAVLTAHWLSNPDSLEGKGVSRIQSHLCQTYFVFSPWAFRQMQHSCCPVAVLDLQDRSSMFCGLSWLTLYDAEEKHFNSFSALCSLEGDAQSRAVELKKLFGSEFVCSCTRCLYENEIETGKGYALQLTLVQLKSLADLAMQQARFRDAFGLYELILQTHSHNANVLHARAAAALGIASTSFADEGHCDGYFLRAQKLWEEAGSVNEVCGSHPDIALHVEKQRVYRTAISLDENHQIDSDSDDIQFSTYLNGKCFITKKDTPLLSKDECQFIIKITEDHCNSTSGWTTSRHYSVPTTDVPIHEIHDLHSLFKKLWFDKVRPLMRRQLQLGDNSNCCRRDIFIHDAFVVRYDSSKQKYLPPHIDESSHSFIVALNSDFKGGGTYIHKLGVVLAPTVGAMVSFEGGTLLHSGDPVINGVRYCIVAFCYLDKVEESSAKTVKVTGDINPAPFSFEFQFT